MAASTEALRPTIMAIDPGRTLISASNMVHRYRLNTLKEPNGVAVGSLLLVCAAEEPETSESKT